MSDTPEKTAREMTDTIIDTLELKIRAGEWVSLEAVRREFRTLITSYERQLLTAEKERSDLFENIVRLHEELNKANGDEEECAFL